MEIVFSAQGTAQAVGSNASFFGLCPVECEGRNVLQASEYLYGEGGIVHCVGMAKFLITWEEDGTPEVLKWWVEDGRVTVAVSFGQFCPLPHMLKNDILIVGICLNTNKNRRGKAL